MPLEPRPVPARPSTAGARALAAGARACAACWWRWSRWTRPRRAARARRRRRGEPRVAGRARFGLAWAALGLAAAARAGARLARVLRAARRARRVARARRRAARARPRRGGGAGRRARAAAPAPRRRRRRIDWGSEWYQRRAGEFLGFMRADLRAQGARACRPARAAVLRARAEQRRLPRRRRPGAARLVSRHHAARRLLRELRRAPGARPGDRLLLPLRQHGGLGAGDPRRRRTSPPRAQANPRWEPRPRASWRRTLARAERLAAGGGASTRSWPRAEPEHADAALDAGVSPRHGGDSAAAIAWFGTARRRRSPLERATGRGPTPGSCAKPPERTPAANRGSGRSALPCRSTCYESQSSVNPRARTRDSDGQAHPIRRRRARSRCAAASTSSPARCASRSGRAAATS